MDSYVQNEKLILRIYVRILPMPTARKNREAMSVNSTSAKFHAISAIPGGTWEPPPPPIMMAALVLSNVGSNVTDAASDEEFEGRLAKDVFELIGEKREEDKKLVIAKQMLC